MRTALFIHSWRGATETVSRHWEYYKRSGFELFGVGRIDSTCVWPEKIPTRNIGEDSYISGDNLPSRLVETFRWYIHDPQFNDFTHAMVIEYDTLFLRPPPYTEIDVAAHQAGGNIPPMKAQCFWHNPWWLSRARALEFVCKGEELLAKGENEGGNPDFAFGLVWQELGVFPKHLEGTFSRNSFDIPADRIMARDRVRRNELWAIHGIKKQSELNEILS